MIVLRHGQSQFNAVFTATRRDPGIKDPGLTPLGAQQADGAADALANLGVERILVSPYTRALQTAAAIARRTGLALEVTDLVREHYYFVCDIGTPRSQLAAEWPDVDFSAIDEIWWPCANESRESVAARAAHFRQLMAERPDQARTVVVCHWGFGLALTGRQLANGEWMAVDPRAPVPVVTVPTL